MRTKLVTLLFIGLLVAADSPKDAAEKEAKRLEGAWVVTSAQKDGQPLDRIKGNKLVIAGPRFTIKTKTIELEGSFRLDPAKKPKQIDFLHEKEFLRDKTWKAIYSLEGDELKICYADADSGKERPTEFKTAKDSGYQLVVVQREKK